jgi:hypothetical protein
LGGFLHAYAYEHGLFKVKGRTQAEGISKGAQEKAFGPTRRKRRLEETS